jgi:YesN/AraC family two-component response regulator
MNNPGNKLKTNSDKDYMVKAVQYIQNNYSRNITVQDMSKSISLNRSYFCGLFKKNFQLSPKQYLTNFRIAKACELMKLGSLNINEIARSVGYQDPLHFSREFKKNKGRSPKEYMKEDYDKIGSF